MASKRELRRIIDRKDETFLNHHRSVSVARRIAELERDSLARVQDAHSRTLKDRNDLLTLLGKTEADLPELRQAASALRYADEHEKQMALAGDWA